MNYFNAKRYTTYAVLGSGGHTSEMSQILQSLHCKFRNRYQPCFYLLASSDTTSRHKIHDELQSRGIPITDDSFIEIPRSRFVNQSWITSIFTTIWAIIVCFWLLLRDKPALILCNGPGTCVPVCLAAYLLRLFRLLPRHTKIVFVESICRVKTLSLSGRILCPFVDLIVVQWESLAEQYKRKVNVKCFGRLM